MSTNSLLTRCKQRAVRYLAMRTNSILTPCKVRYFHVTPCIKWEKMRLEK